MACYELYFGIYEENLMDYKLFPNLIRLLTVLSIIVSFAIPIYKYSTGVVINIHYGIVLFITTILGIATTFFSQKNVTKVVLDWFVKYRNILSIGCILIIIFAAFLAVNDVISYDFIILCITFLVFVFSIFFSNDITRRKTQVIIFTLSLLIATLVWTLFSYMFYYNGGKSAVYQNQVVLFHSVKAVLTSDLPEDVKLNAIQDIAKSTGGEFSIRKDGKEIIKKRSSRPTNIYVLEPIYSKFDSKDYRDFMYDGSRYQLEFKYANRPYYSWGIIRAVTFSIFPDMLYGYSLKAENYLKNQNYTRSTYFWGVFWVFYLMGLMWQYYRDRQNQQTKELLKLSMERKVALDNLQIAYSAYDHMHDEFDKVALRDTRQQLQELNLSWSEIIENVLADSRHTLKNKLQDQPLMTNEEINRLDSSMRLFEHEIEQGINQRLNNFRDIILTHQKELFKTLDYKLRKESIKTIVNHINDNIPCNYFDKNRSGFSFNIQNNIFISNNTLICEVNLNRLFSIVENLLKNANNALAHRILSDESFDNPALLLIYDVKNINEKMALSIVVQDNAGGFPEELINKIYKVPVKSSDTTQSRMGKGSQYVKFFSDRMNATIQVRNIINEYGEKCAQVEVLIPIVSEEGELV